MLMGARGAVLPWLVLACVVMLHTPVRADTGRAEPVRVDFYMEALCPYCANFTVNQLKPLFVNKLINYVQLQLIPWGNARTEPGGQAVCQHGQLECDLNKLLSCATAQYPVQDGWFPFLTCLEELVLSDEEIVVEDVAHKCAVHAGMVTDKLMACYRGPLGETLQRLAAQQTASLQPAHKWVPWVTVNGIPLLEDDENIQRYICTVIYYTQRGRDRPKACLEQPQPTALANSAQPAIITTEQNSFKSARYSKRGTFAPVAVQ